MVAELADQDVVQQPRTRPAALDLLIERAVAWPAAMLYFLAVAEDGRLGHMLYLFVEIRDVIVGWATS